MEIIQPELGTLIWMTIAFGIVFFILARYVWPPIMSNLKQRERSIADALDAARQAKEEISQLKADNERIIAEAKLERDKIIIEARELKDSIVADAKEQASIEGKKMIEAARQAIKNAKDSAINEMREQIINLSIDIAGKVLHQKLSDDDQQRELIEKSLRDVKLN
jgi:F-type H+-transporting ATPase subunit b